MKLKLIIFVGIMGLVILTTLVHSHERVHQEIFRSYNIESEIYMIKYFPDAITIPEEACPDSSCELAHNINDAIGYHAIPFYLFGLTVALVIVGILDNQNE